MKKTVFDYPISLLISVLIIIFIVYYGTIEVNEFIKLKNYQEFKSNVYNIIDSMDYLYNSNSRYSFVNTPLLIPDNQSIFFDSNLDMIILDGFYSTNISLDYNLTNDLFFDSKLNKSLVVCYDCSYENVFVVSFK